MHAVTHTARDQVNRLTPAARVLGTLISAVFGDRDATPAEHGSGPGDRPVVPPPVADTDTPAQAA